MFSPFCGLPTPLHSSHYLFTSPQVVGTSFFQADSEPPLPNLSKFSLDYVQAFEPHPLIWTPSLFWLPLPPGRKCVDLFQFHYPIALSEHSGESCLHPFWHTLEPLLPARNWPQIANPCWTGWTWCEEVPIDPRGDVGSHKLDKWQ